MGRAQSRRTRARRPGLTRRRRRRLLAGVGAIVGSLIATAGGWLYAGARPALPEKSAPADSHRGLTPIHPELRLDLGPRLADPRVRGGMLELPVVDWAELLPGCH